jgi:hypothetical protein
MENDKSERLPVLQHYTVPELEFLNNLWGLGTEEKLGYRTGPSGYMAGGIHSLESTSGLHKRLKIRALFVIANIVHSINIDGLASQSPFPKKRHDIYENADVLRRPKKSLQMDSAVNFCPPPPMY